MDFAFRRRFAFKEIKASENLGMLDDLEENLEGARALGIHTILVRDQAQAARDLRALLQDRSDL